MDLVAAIVVAGLLQGGIYALISLGLTLMFGVLRVVNFGHGDFLMVAMYLTFLSVKFFGFDTLAASIITVPLFFITGTILYHLIIKRTFTASDPLLAQVFATVGLSILLQNLTLLIAGADVRQNESQIITGSITMGDIRMESIKMLILGSAFVLGILVSLFLYKTTLGKQMRAVAQNTTAATLMGINVQRIYGWTFAISCAVIGLGGTLLSMTELSYPTVGLKFSLICFMTVVIGGLGSIRGAILGGLLIGVVEAGTSYLFGPIFSQAFVYVIFLAVLLLRPAGLFGQEGYLEAKAE